MVAGRRLFREASQDLVVELGEILVAGVGGLEGDGGHDES